MVREHHPKHIEAKGIQNGATCLDIRHGLPKDPSEIESDDVTIAGCMFNRISRKQYTKLTKGFSTTAQAQMPVLGGSASLWGMSDGMGPDGLEDGQHCWGQRHSPHHWD